MHTTASDRYSVRFRSDDFDEFADATRDWDLDFRPLAHGGVALHQIGFEGVQTVRVRIDPHVHQVGHSPPGCRTFGVVEEGVSLRWCGREVDDRQLLVRHSDGTFDAASRPGFRVFTVSFPEALLEDAADSLGLGGLDRLLPRTEEAALCSPELLAPLRARLRRIHDAPDRLASDPSSRIWDELLFELPAQVLTAVRPSATVDLPSPRTRDRALRRALAYLEAHPREALRVRDLCRVAESSERTLRYAFEEHFGVSPKAYLNALRLNRARRELRLADPDRTKVSDVANRWGFWHMGQFAADYRRLFGELPSRTLGSSRP